MSLTGGKRQYENDVAIASNVKVKSTVKLLARSRL